MDYTKRPTFKEILSNLEDIRQNLNRELLFTDIRNLNFGTVELVLRSKGNITFL